MNSKKLILSFSFLQWFLPLNYSWWLLAGLSFQSNGVWLILWLFHLVSGFILIDNCFFFFLVVVFFKYPWFQSLSYEAAVSVLSAITEDKPKVPSGPCRCVVYECGRYALTSYFILPSGMKTGRNCNWIAFPLLRQISNVQRAPRSQKEATLPFQKQRWCLFKNWSRNDSGCDVRMI